MDSNMKAILGYSFLFAGGLAMMVVVGGILTMYLNAVYLADSPAKLTGFSPTVTAFVLGLAIVLIWGGTVLVKSRLIALGVSFLFWGVGLLIIANIFPTGTRGDILSTLSLQAWPSGIGVATALVGMLLAYFGFQKGNRHKNN